MLSTAVFGGTQIIVAMLNIIRGKFVAIFLGAAGMGLSSLLLNAGNCIQQVVMMGVNQSGVREISQANADGEKLLGFSRIVRNLIMVSAIIGLIVTLIFSPVITSVSVGNMDYLMYFMLLGVAVFLNILGLGEYTILQGTRQYKSIAYSTVVIPACGLLIGIPVYYKWGMDGIVPTMILQSFIYYASVRYFADKYGLKRQPLPRISLRDTWLKGKGMIMLGMVLMVSSLLVSLTSYAISAFISNTGSMADLGFYQASNMITMQCSNLVFSAMATDYYPKLAGIIDKDMAAAHRLVNQQAEIVLLTITPISMIIMSTVPFIITLFLTDEFMVICRMLRLMSCAVIFKAMCYPVDYMSFSKGDKKYFFWVEGIFANVRMLIVFILFYYYLGLDGLGYAALFFSSMDIFVSLALNRWRYGFHLSRTVIYMFVRLIFMVFACLAFSFIENTLVSYSLMGIATLLCCLYSYRQLDRRIDIKSLIRHRENL